MPTCPRPTNAKPCSGSFIIQQPPQQPPGQKSRKQKRAKYGKLQMEPMGVEPTTSRVRLQEQLVSKRIQAVIEYSREIRKLQDLRRFSAFQHIQSTTK